MGSNPEVNPGRWGWNASGIGKPGEANPGSESGSMVGDVWKGVECVEVECVECVEC